MNEDSGIVSIGDEGEVQLKSPLFFCLGYKGEPEETKNGMWTEDGFFKTGYLSSSISIINGISELKSVVDIFFPANYQISEHYSKKS